MRLHACVKVGRKQPFSSTLDQTKQTEFFPDQNKHRFCLQHLAVPKR